MGAARLRSYTVAPTVVKAKNRVLHHRSPYGTINAMKRPILQLTEEQRKIAAELGRIGGRKRARNLSPEERRRSAIKASRAAAAARTAKAKARKAVK